jgi:hypothetical protein
MQTINNYQEAERFYNKQPTFKNSIDRVCEQKQKYGAIGRFASGQPKYGYKPNGNNTAKRMRMLPDKSIQFEYAGEPFCTYHPDGQVTVQAPSTRRWGNFYYQVLPKGLYLDTNGRSGRIALIGHHIRGISWWDRSHYTGVVRTDKPVRLKVGDDGLWRPVNEQQLTPFKWKEVDRKPARKLAQEKHISGFWAWLRAYRKLQDIETDGGGSSWLTAAELAAAVEQQDYKRVYDGLRRNWSYWVADDGSWQSGLRISRGHFEQMRMKVYADGGALIDKEMRVPTVKQWRHIERQLRKFERV